MVTNNCNESEKVALFLLLFRQTESSPSANVHCDDNSDNEIDLSQEIRQIIAESEVTDVNLSDEENIAPLAQRNQQKKKSINAVLSSPAYINAMKQNIEKKEAALKKKQENRAQRLEKAKEKMNKMSQNIRKLEAQVNTDK